MKRIFITFAAAGLTALAATTSHAQTPQGYFKLQSAFTEGEGRCLEGSKPFAANDPLKGAARMDPCGNFSGQFWRAIPTGNGYFQLTNMFLEGEGRCLEGSIPFAPNDPMNGAARMDPCGNFSGQMWRMSPLGNGYFKLTNMFLEPEGRCLESSKPFAANDPLGGAARMDPCGNFSGQMWRMIPR